MPVVCRGCGADAGVRERVGRRDVCASCGVDLHSCRQCRHYDVRAYNECRESQAERVLDKQRANFCDWFAPAEDLAGTVRRGAPAASPSARGATAADPRAELDRLFRRR